VDKIFDIPLILPFLSLIVFDFHQTKAIQAVGVTVPLNAQPLFMLHSGSYKFLIFLK